MSKCKIWQKAKNKDGYGQKRVGGKVWYVHRWIWTLAHGEIPEGMCVCHKCDNPSCYKFSHLFIGTQKDNMADRDSKGRLHLNTGKNYNQGEQHSNSKLSEEDVFKILNLLHVGERPSRIAKIFGVDARTVSSIKCGTTWKHLTTGQNWGEV